MGDGLFIPGRPIAAKVSMRPIGYRRNGSAIWPIAGAAAPSVRGVGTFGSGTTSCTAGLPSGWAAGDLHICVVESSDSNTAAGTPNTPSGWTKLFEETQGAGATGVVTLTIFGRIAVGGDGSLTVDGVGNHVHAQIIGITTGTHGVATVSTDVVVGTGAGSATTTMTLPGITVTADSLVLGCIAVTDDAIDTDNVTAFTNSNLASITQRFDESETSGAGGGVSCWSGTCAGTTTGDSTGTHDTAANARFVHLGIPPASGQVDKTASDTPTVSLTESQASLVSSSVSDTPTVSLGEASAVMVPLTASDTPTVSLGELAELLVALTGSDTPTLSVDEASASFLSSERIDTPTLTLGEAQDSLVMSSVVDTPTLSVGEASSVAVLIVTSDAVVIGVTEGTPAILALLGVSDTATISVGEAAVLLGLIGVADTVTVSLGELAEVFIGEPPILVVASDVVALALSELSRVKHISPPEMVVVRVVSQGPAAGRRLGPARPFPPRRNR